jgi:hypothetical protein
MQGHIITNFALERALKLTNTIPPQATNVRFIVQVPGLTAYFNAELDIGQGTDNVALQVRYDMPVAATCHTCRIHAARLAGYAKP